MKGNNNVILSGAKNLGNIKVDVYEIFRTESSTTRLPPYGRLNDKLINVLLFDTPILYY